jgi:N-acetylmuramoyl-L-alanine amidase
MAENYQVKQGDCISSIAFEKGFFPDTIWNHPENENLKELRKDPSVLLPGDSVYIPDKRLREYSESTNQVYKYKCKNTPKTLQFQFIEYDSPVKDMEYVLDVDGVESKGKTDGNGMIKRTIIPNAKVAKLTFENGEEFILDLGRLDPVDEVSGLQGHLSRLGLFAGRIDGKMNDETKEAITEFQRSNGLEETGEPDTDTKRLLEIMTGR